MTLKLQKRFKVGDTATMTEAALENYGEQYRGKKFEIEHVARSKQEHPGFDEGAGCALYDFKDLNFSLYDYELN